MRHLGLILCLALPSCGFFGDSDNLCSQWCSFLLCTQEGECSEDEFRGPCEDACEEPAEELNDRDHRLIRDCITCLNEGMGGDECNVEDFIDAFEDCNTECAEDAVELIGEEFSDEFEENLDEENLECLDEYYYEY